MPDCPLADFRKAEAFRVEFHDFLADRIHEPGADIDRHPAEVVTVYRTSDITRYWRP